MNKYEYNGPDDDILDEDRIGRRGFDSYMSNDALIALVFGIISVFMALFRFSGIIAIITGLVATSQSAKVLRLDPENSMAKLSRILGLVGLIVGTVFFVTCISCISCIGCNGYYRYPVDWRFF